MRLKARLRIRGLWLGHVMLRAGAQNKGRQTRLQRPDPDADTDADTYSNADTYPDAYPDGPRSGFLFRAVGRVWPRL